MDVKRVVTGVVAAIAVIPVAIMLGEKIDTAESVEAPNNQVVSDDPVQTADSSHQENNEQLQNSAASEEPSDNSMEHAQSATTVTLIDSFKLIAPNDSSICATLNPWENGVREVSEGDSLSSNDCFAIRVSVLEDIELYLLSHSEDGTLIRLFPNSCDALGPVNARINSGEEIQLPQDQGGNHLVIGLDEQVGQEWFYSLGVSDASSKQAIQDLIADVPDVCQETESYKMPVSDFQDSLNQLQAQYSSNLHWLAHSFYHN
jgi:hypothetical protein